MADGILRTSLDVTHKVFVYGSLLDPELFEIVAGIPLKGRPAKLPDASVRNIVDQSHPVLTAEPGHDVGGLLVEVDDAAKSRLDYYQFGFERSASTIRVEGEEQIAEILIPKAKQSDIGARWSLPEWQKQHGEFSKRAAREIIALFATHNPDDTARNLPQIKMRVASQMRAESDPTPSELAPDISARLRSAKRSCRPYTDYFSVQEDWLSFPTFDGGQSPVVKRASFVGGDAVTVLPYDPRMDAVLVVRQFRHGPFVRGDTNPWTLEPAAGRIDPGETPEDCAHRELQEETGVAAASLHLVGRYYPTPGAFTEYLYSYVALADLSGRDGSVGGLATEDENIMAHVIALEDAAAMAQSGAANTGPLLISLWWLQLNKGKFRID